MKHRCHAYFLLLLALLICSCGSVPMTQEFKNNNRFSKFDARDFKPGLIRFLDYHVFKEVSLVSNHSDSIIRSGILLPGRSIEEDQLTREVCFGKEGDTCLIHYDLKDKYHHEGRSATVSVINAFSKKSNKIPQSVTYTNLGNEITGFIKYPALAGEASFSMKNFHAVEYTYGQLLINQDTFLLRPAKGNSLQLSKGDVTFAIIQQTIMDKIYIYTRASATEQMLIAAFFVVLERNWK